MSWLWKAIAVFMTTFSLARILAKLGMVDWKIEKLIDRIYGVIPDTLFGIVETTILRGSVEVPQIIRDIIVLAVTVWLMFGGAFRRIVIEIGEDHIAEHDKYMDGQRKKEYRAQVLSEANRMFFIWPARLISDLSNPVFHTLSPRKIAVHMVLSLVPLMVLIAANGFLP